jgi:hypothetical protein
VEKESEDNHISNLTGRIPTRSSVSSPSHTIITGNIPVDSKFNTNNVDGTSVTNFIYVGKEDASGTYQIKKIDLTSGYPTVTYASITNNPTYTTYSTAWTNHLTLTYSLYEIAF